MRPAALSQGADRTAGIRIYLVTVVVAEDVVLPDPSGLALLTVAVFFILVPDVAVTFTVIATATGVSSVMLGAVHVTVLLAKLQLA